MGLLSWFTGKTTTGGGIVSAGNAVDVPQKTGLIKRFTGGVASLFSGVGGVVGTGVSAVLTPLLPIIILIVVAAIFANVAAKKVI